MSESIHSLWLQWARYGERGMGGGAKQLLEDLSSRYPALTIPEIRGVLNSLVAGRISTTPLTAVGPTFEVGELYVLLGWANSIKLQRSILRRITHGRGRGRGTLRADVRRGKAGVTEEDVEYKGLYFRTMAQQEARMNERLIRGPNNRIKEKLPDKVPIGTRIRFVQDVEQPEDEEFPLQIFACKGQFGKVTGHNSWKSGHYVETEDAPGHTFSAEFKTEFVIAEEEGQ